MSSYNDYDGVPISASTEFMTDILRTRLGFTGYVVSDSQGANVVMEPLKAHSLVSYTFLPPNSFLTPRCRSLSPSLSSPRAAALPCRSLSAIEYLVTKHRVANNYSEGAKMFLEAGGNVRTEFEAPDGFVLPVQHDPLFISPLLLASL